MKCEKFEERMQRLLDRRRRPELDDRLISHVQACDACRRLLIAQEMLADGLAVIEDPPISPDFSRRVVARAASGRRLRRASLFAAGVAVAAAVLIALGVLRSSLAPPARVSVSGPLAAARLDDGPSIRQTDLPAAEADIFSDDTEPGGDDDVPGDGQPAQQYQQLLESWKQQISAVSLERFETVAHLSEGLRPIASSFGAAWDVLRHSLPVAQPPEPTEPQAVGPISNAGRMA